MNVVYTFIHPYDCVRFCENEHLEKIISVMIKTTMLLATLMMVIVVIIIFHSEMTTAR